MEGKRDTFQRRLIYEAVRELGTHPAAEQVYAYVAKKHPSVSKATVYRNLSQMSEAGELLNIGSFHGSSRYDHNCHNHYHFICEKCKLVFDIDACFPELSGKITNAGGFEIKGHRLTFSGLCRDCKDQKST